MYRNNIVQVPASHCVSQAAKSKECDKNRRLAGRQRDRQREKKRMKAHRKHFLSFLPVFTYAHTFIAQETALKS